MLVLGGASRGGQIQKIARGVDVVIATPGRLKDLVDDKKLRLTETRWLVLDEADRMLDMGFINAVKQIAAAIGPRRQTAMFSATMAPEIAELAKGLLNDPVRVEANPAAQTVGTIDQRVILAGSKEKRGVLNELLEDEALSRVIIFSRTKHGADRVAKNLVIDGHEAAAIHGNKSNNARQAALKGFATGNVRILVATDIAARGIDVQNITHVINFELPDDPENYVHRIGRTARNGASGYRDHAVRRHRARQAARRRAADPPDPAGHRRAQGQWRRGHRRRRGSRPPPAAAQPGAASGGTAQAGQCRPAFLGRQEGGDRRRSGPQRRQRPAGARWRDDRQQPVAQRRGAGDGPGLVGEADRLGVSDPPQGQQAALEQEAEGRRSRPARVGPRGGLTASASV